MDKKLIVYLVLLAALVGLTAWSTNRTLSAQDSGYTDEQIDQMLEDGDYEEDPLTGKPILPDAQDENSGAFVTFGLFIITGIFSGFLVITYLLPNLVQRASEEMLGSTEVVKDSQLVKAQSSVAQGDWNSAIESYRLVAAEEPDNRLPWVEIAMLQRERLHDSDAALATLDEALARGGWRDNDEAFFLFRKIEIYENDKRQHEKAVATLRDVISRFPETRHSANAKHKLREIGEA